MNNQNGMTENKKRHILLLRMERQYLMNPAKTEEYDRLYRDTQPGQNVYWHGFGEPPVLSFRTDFDDKEYNRLRQSRRELVKGRFQGGNLGWIVKEDMELFACLCRKPLEGLTWQQEQILTLIDRLGPMNIQQIKEETGMLVKEITPVLHRLQEAFILYEDQYDGEWDRAWYRFGEMFPEVNLERYTQVEALKIILKRFAYRMVWFDAEMAKAFYKLPAKDIKTAVRELVEENAFVEVCGGYMSRNDWAFMEAGTWDVSLHNDGSGVACGFTGVSAGVLVMHRNDILVKAFEHQWKTGYKEYIAECRERFPEASDFEVLFLLLMDGEIHGAVLGKFKYGPYIVEDIVVDKGFEKRRKQILEALRKESPGSEIHRFMGK